jgi:SAM-dependent methyltransferase
MVSKEQQNVNNEWNSMAGEWDDLASGYRDSFLKILWQQTGINPGTERIVVDFGCGTGLLTESMRRQSPNSEFVCLDAAPAMVRVLDDKIKAGEWKNVRAHCIVLANHNSADQKIQEDLEALKGKVDLVVASSVLNFIPHEDLPETMKVIGQLLKPSGLFCHSDWPESDGHENGFTEEKAGKVYEMAGLEKKSTIEKTINMGSQEGKVLFGVAAKPREESQDKLSKTFAR